ncbi:MAG: hypothetical protein U1C46_09460 [Bacteroidales bacterium]|nr:hypothetical protein [Bacteroidales bacterium]MDZ4205030.1 hypothetical protein [Bacteroidales bacterium]
MAQYYTYGQDPFSQKWRQLNTEHFHLIYPEKWDTQVYKLAFFLEAIKDPLSSSLNSKTREIPVILRNQTMLSNGFVIWAPKRMELVTTIPYDNQATDWLQHLAVHEFRHVVQVEAINVSTTRFFSKIFGQHITGSIVGLHIPLWFLEGDAVLAETSFSKTGRGRLPSFSMPLAAQVLEKGTYSYDKATLGSYRDMVPNHYILGYNLVAATHSKYGFAPFQRALKNVGAIPFLPGSFSRGVKKETGKSLRSLYDSTIVELEQDWQKSIGSEPVSVFQPIEGKNKLDYTSYYSPHYLNDTSIITIRTTPSDIPRLVKINHSGKEEVLFSPGYGYYSSLSYANGWAAWIEIKFDPRWEYRNYTNIRVLEIATGKNHLVTRKGRLQSPKLSPDGSKVAAIEVDDLNQWRLLVFDTYSGAELYRISDSSIQFLSEPCWDSNSDAFIAVAFSEETGKSLVITQLDNPRFKPLFHAGFVEISMPTVHNNMIWFTGSWSGRDEIYALDLDSQRLFRAVATSYGAKDAILSSDASKVVFLELTATGNKIAEAPANQLKPVDEKTIANKSLRLYDRAVMEENFLAEDIRFPDTTYETKKYSAFLNLLHFHSWIPASLDVDGMTGKPGITVFSQDLLGSTVFAMGYEHEPSNSGNKVFADLSFKALYPKIDVRFETGAENRYYRAQDQSLVKLKTNFNKITGAISLPLSFNRHTIIYGIIPRVSTSQEFSSYTYLNKNYDRSLQSLSYRSSIYAYRRMALRDLFPRIGFSSAVSFGHTPFAGGSASTSIDAGTMKSFEFSAFLPGLLRHHSSRFYFGTQERERGRTYFNDVIRFARGYTSSPNPTLSTISASYSLPLWYPDLSLGSIVYAKRMRANMFYDLSHSPVDGGETSWSSFGLDLIIDAHLLRMPMPFELGVRALYRVNDRKIGFELISGVDFYAVGRMLGINRNMPPAY